MEVNHAQLAKLKKDFNILWDFDGTICDTYPVIGREFVDYAAANGITLDLEEVLPFLKTHLSDISYRHFGLPKPPRSVSEEQDRCYWNEIRTPLFDGVELGMTLGSNYLVSNRSRRSIEEIFQLQGIALDFRDMITAQDEPHNFPRKPDSSMYREVAHRHGEIHLVIGDRSVDMDPARELGWKTCSFRSEHLDTDYYLSNYWELPGIYLARLFDIVIPRRKQPLTHEFLESIFRDTPGRFDHIIGVSNRTPETPLALLHDIGYAKCFQRTGFHPLDGALAALELGYMDYHVILPILFHSYADTWADLEEIPELAWLYDRLTHFRVAPGLEELIAEITFADLTTDHLGKPVDVEERIAGILRRYPKGNPIHDNIVVHRRDILGLRRWHRG